MSIETEKEVWETAGPVVALFGEVLADVFPDQSVMGGAPFNVARHLRAFGLHPVLISRTGDDGPRDSLLQEMEQRDMNISGIQCDPEYPTGQVKVIIDNGGHRFDILPDQAYDRICSDATRNTLAEAKPWLAYFGTLAQRSAVSRQSVKRFLDDCDCTRFLDINLRDPWYDPATIAFSLDAADIVKLNDEELAVIAAMLGWSDLEPEAQAAALQQRFDLKQVLVTCGASGSWLLDERQQVLRARPAESGMLVVDTVGAGDAYAAMFMLGMLREWDTTAILQRASDYAAACCTVRGAVPPPGDFTKLFE